MGRERWPDVAKGLAIVMVVYGHVARGLMEAGFATPCYLQTIDYGIYAFHMPVFFLLSGIWVDRSIAEGRMLFLKRRAWTVAYPYVLWSLIQGGIMLALAGSINAPPTLADLGSIWFRPMAQWWFLYVLMIFHVAAVCFWPHRYILLAAALAGLVAAPFLPGVLTQISYNLIFYVVGAWLGRSGLPGPQSATKMFLIGCACLMFVALAAPVFMRWSPSPNTLVTLPLTIVGCIGLIAISMAAHRSKALGMLGAASMTIYVLHILAGAGTRVLLAKAGVPAVLLLYLVVCTLVGILGPLVAHYVLQRLKLSPYLGLTSLPKRSQHPSAA